MLNLQTTFAGVSFKNPIVTASGTYGFGREYGEYLDLNELGGICVKGLTLLPRRGNPAPRVMETPAGMLNSVGLQNPGVDAFLQNELPFLRQFDTRVIANISGNTAEEYAEMARKLSVDGVDILEINISCPNIKAGGAAFGQCPTDTAAVTQAVRAATDKPVMIKLSPNVTDIVTIAKAAEDAGADALCLINTLLGMKIDIHKRKPHLANIMGGLSGPAFFPVAVRMVYQVAKAINIPILGMGGVMTGDDAIEMLLAGANLVGVGTACFADPQAPLLVRDGIAGYMERYGMSNLGDIVMSV